MVQQGRRILLVELDLVVLVLPTVVVAVVVKEHLLGLVGMLKMVMMEVLVL